VPPELAQGFPQISGGGQHTMVMRTIIIDVPIPYVPVERLIQYAQERNLPLDDLQPYVLQRLQAAQGSLATGLSARSSIMDSFTATDAAFQDMKAKYDAAAKRKDTEAMKILSKAMLEISGHSTEIAAQLGSMKDIIESQDETVKHWQYLLGLVKPAKP
jgi:hypothetical protein